MIQTYRLVSGTGAEAVISNLGCILMSLKIPASDGNLRETVLGFDDIAHYQSPAYLDNYVYFGAIIGRYANRICNGSFKINGKKYELAKNAGLHTLHGGIHGFDKKIWTLTDHNPGRDGYLVLQYHSPAGEEGFPGNLNVKMHISLSGSALHYEITADTDSVTPVNLTWHNYFNLDLNHTHIGDQVIRIPATGRLVQDSTLCPTGEIADPASFSDDIRNWTRLQQLSDLDSTFLLDTRLGKLTLAGEAISSDRKINLQVYTDQPAVHVYTGSGNPVLTARNNVLYGAGNGYCFETQLPPDALNHGHFPDPLLMPGQTYRHCCSYVFR